MGGPEWADGLRGRLVAWLIFRFKGDPGLGNSITLLVPDPAQKYLPFSVQMFKSILLYQSGRLQAR